VLALAVVVSFSAFGAWQLDRHAHRAARNAVLEARLAAPSVSLDQVLAEAAAERARRDEAGERGALDPLAYRRVHVTGHFEPAHEVLRRPVSRAGVPGFHVVTPLVLGDGSAVLVERGWVPQAHDRVPVGAAPPPRGEVTLAAWAFPGETPPSGPLAALAPRDPPHGPLERVAYVDLERLALQMPFTLQPLRLVLEAGDHPPAAAGLPLPPEGPIVTAGPHLGYALQWFAFVVITVIGYGALLRARWREPAREPSAVERAAGAVRREPARPPPP
jgi:surfeit locus 1 family protein